MIINNAHNLSEINYSMRFFFLICTFFLLNYSVYCQDEDNPCKVKNKQAEKIFKKATNEYKSGNISNSAKLFKETIDEEPDYVDAYYALGKIYLRKSFFNLSSVKRNFKKVEELCPTYDPEIYYYLGDIYLGEADGYYNKGDFKHAEKKYDSAYFYFKEFIKDPDKIKSEAKYNHADSVVKYTKTLKDITSKPVPFNPVFVKGISTSLDEYLPVITPDNNMAFFVRKFKAPLSKSSLFKTEDKYMEKFMFSIRDAKGDFDIGKEMEHPFNTTDNQGAATITIDNKTLYFVVCEWLKDNSYFNCDICMSEFINERWSDIKNLGLKVNGNKTWETQPSISNDGKTLYFISDRNGGYGGYDMYKTTKDAKGEWGLAENMGPYINTSGNEKSPFIHTDDQTLYFSSTGLPGLGGYDIFMSKRGSDNKFGLPRNLGYPINTQSDDVGFFVSTDGHYGYFASNKYKGPGGWDIYYFDLYPEARPDSVLFVKGNVKEELKNETNEESDNAPIFAKVELKNIKTNQVKEIPVDSITGKYVIATAFKNDYMLTVKSDSFAYISKYISKKDTNFQKVAQVDFEIKSIEVGESYQLNDILFAFGNYDLEEDSKRTIDGFIDFLNDHPTMKVSINGHTDNVSGADFNQTLSENRAKSVYDYMIEKGVDALRLTYKGFGITKPVATNETEEGRTKNRRTEFVIIEK